MKTVATFEDLNLPSWAVCAIEYGDLSGLEAGEDQEILNWMESFELQPGQSLVFSYGEESFFSSSPEFGLPGDCIDCTATILES